MAHLIKPDDFKIQRPGDTVVYDADWAEWEPDLETQPRDVRVHVETSKGAPCVASLLPAIPGRRLTQIVVRSPGSGRHTIVRTVVTKAEPKEVRTRKFTVLVE